MGPDSLLAHTKGTKHNRLHIHFVPEDNIDFAVPKLHTYHDTLKIMLPCTVILYVQSVFCMGQIEELKGDVAGSTTLVSFRSLPIT